MNVIDTLLDRSIALGYGNLGLKLRRRPPGWPADTPRARHWLSDCCEAEIS